MTSRQNSIELDGTTIPITIGNYTNRSSQVSLYRSSCLSRVKFISLIVSFSLSVATLAIASNIYKTETMRNTTTDAIRLIAVPRFNSTLCDYFKHFFQSGNYFATGCSYLENVYRKQFINGKPTDKDGVYLNIRQRNYLEKMLPNLNHSTSFTRGRWIVSGVLKKSKITCQSVYYIYIYKELIK